MTEPAPIFGSREALGTYHAVSCKDPSSMERDGEPYYDFNRLPSSTGRSVGEVMFADGIWFLCDPENDLVP